MWVFFEIVMFLMCGCGEGCLSFVDDCLGGCCVKCVCLCLGMFLFFLKGMIMVKSQKKLNCEICKFKVEKVFKVNVLNLMSKGKVVEMIMIN